MNHLLIALSSSVLPFLWAPGQDPLDYPVSIEYGIITSYGEGPEKKEPRPIKIIILIPEEALESFSNPYKDIPDVLPLPEAPKHDDWVEDGND